MKKPKRDYKLEQKVGDPRKIKTEDFKRSNHNDFATSSELRKRQYSGMRMNSIAQELEIWVVGEIRATIPAPNGRVDDEAVDAVFKSIFAMH